MDRLHIINLIFLMTLLEKLIAHHSIDCLDVRFVLKSLGLIWGWLDLDLAENKPLRRNVYMSLGSITRDSMLTLATVVDEINRNNMVDEKETLLNNLRLGDWTGGESKRCQRSRNNQKSDEWTKVSRMW